MLNQIINRVTELISIYDDYIFIFNQYQLHLICQHNPNIGGLWGDFIKAKTTSHQRHSNISHVTPRKRKYVIMSDLASYFAS